MAQAYFSLVTTVGKIKLAASAAGGDPVVITHFAVGDGNGAETNPTAAVTALVREVWRTPVESVVVDPENPSAVLVTAIIPTSQGGWWMREFGIFDDDGAMVAVAKPVSQYKPTALEGQLEDIRYEFQIIIGETAQVTLLVDPSLLFATRSWVENRKIPMAQMMRLPWLPVISMTTTAPPVGVAQGDAYLVPAAATGAWAANIGKVAEWNGSAWSYSTPSNGHGIGLPDGRVFERVGGAYVEKIALDVQSGKWNYTLAGGTADVLTASLAPTPSAYANGLRMTLVPILANTGSATLNVNGLGALPIKRPGGADLQIGDISPGIPLSLICFSGTFYIVGIPQASGGTSVFVTPGVTNFVVPAGIYKIRRARIWGGGGGGRGGSASVVGSGGGAGAYVELSNVSVTPGQSIPVTVGVGGNAGAAANSGSAGQASSFGSFGTAGGGGRGDNGVPGPPGVATITPGAICLDGGRGYLGSSGIPLSGNGGGSPFGGGNSVSSATSGGSAGNSPGGGGSGGGVVSGGTTGGPGADGMVILEY